MRLAGKLSIVGHPRGAKRIAQAARAIVSAVEGDRTIVVKPAVFKLLFFMAALWPGLMERRLTPPPRRMPPPPRRG